MLPSREELVRFRHVLALGVWDVEHFELSSARIPVFVFLLDGGFLPASAGTSAAATASVIRFCRHFVTAFLACTRVIDKEPGYYPFDFAFFVQKAPRRFPPRKSDVEISTAPTGQKNLSVTSCTMNLLMARPAETHEVATHHWCRPPRRERCDGLPRRQRSVPP
jgi:hypothetical protein